MRRFLAIVPAAVLAAGWAAPAGAATLRLAPGEAVQAALDRAQDGDVIELAAGDYKGGIRIDRPVTLAGQPGAKLVGDGTGSVESMASRLGRSPRRAGNRPTGRPAAGGVAGTE